MPEKDDIVIDVCKRCVIDVCKRCVIGGVGVFKRDERGAQVMRRRDGGGCDRPRPFRIIAIWAGFVLAQCRGSTVTGAQLSCCICIMHWYWGL